MNVGLRSFYSLALEFDFVSDLQFTIHFGCPTHIHLFAPDWIYLIASNETRLCHKRQRCDKKKWAKNVSRFINVLTYIYRTISVSRKNLKRRFSIQQTIILHIESFMIVPTKYVDNAAKYFSCEHDKNGMWMWHDDRSKIIHII